MVALRMVRSEDPPLYEVPSETERRQGFAMIPAEVFALNDMAALSVYAVLAKHANRDGECWPSVQTICEALGVSKKTVQPAIDRLVEAKIVTKERRFSHGMKQSNVYRITAYGRMEPTVPTLAPTVPLDGTHGSIGWHPGNHKQEPVELEPIEVVTPPQPPKSRSRKPAEESEEFVRFYDAYPRHQGRSDACRAWRAVDPDPAMVEVIMAGLERLLPEYRARPPDKVPLPATWLNGSRWRDEPMRAAAFNGNGFQRKPGTYSAAELAAMAQQGGGHGQNRDDEAALDTRFRLVQ